MKALIPQSWKSSRQRGYCQAFAQSAATTTMMILQVYIYLARRGSGVRWCLVGSSSTDYYLHIGYVFFNVVCVRSTPGSSETGTVTYSCKA